MSDGQSTATTAGDPRRVAALAISELFLDTELDERDFARLRDALRGSRLSIRDLDEIYYDQVAPILHRNLNSPAGEWSGFDPDWLEREIRRQASRRPGLGPLARLRRYLATRSTIDDWRRLRAMVDASR